MSPAGQRAVASHIRFAVGTSVGRVLLPNSYVTTNITKKFDRVTRRHGENS